MHLDPSLGGSVSLFFTFFKICVWFIIVNFILNYKYLSQNTGSQAIFFFFFWIISLSLLHILFYFFNNCSALAKKSVVLAPSKSFTYLLTIVAQGTQQWNFLITFVADKYFQPFFGEENSSDTTILSIFTLLTHLHMLAFGKKNFFFSRF